MSHALIHGYVWLWIMCFASWGPQGYYLASFSLRTITIGYFFLGALTPIFDDGFFIVFDFDASPPGTWDFVVRGSFLVVAIGWAWRAWRDNKNKEICGSEI